MVSPAVPIINGIRAANPYLGPRPFAPADAYRFFGREGEAEELYSLVAAHRTVLLYAQSGAGKTSLLNAGLIPKLEQGGFDVLPTARVSGIPEHVPGDGANLQVPNLYVLNCIANWNEDPVTPDAGLPDILAARPRRRGADGKPLPRVAIFDQFEELFTAYPERWQERRGLFEQLDAAMAADPSLRALFAMREDFVACIDPYEDLVPEQFRTRYRLEQLRADAAQEAVERPLEGTGLRFKPGVAKLLVDDLLSISAAPPGEAPVCGEFVEPVQLQVACFSLFRKLPAGTTEITEEHLTAFGDVNQALREFYQDALKDAAHEAGIDEDSLRQWFESKLITEAGSRGLVFRGESTTAGLPNDGVDILERLHIVRAEPRGRDRWYELSHDRFIQPILRANDAWRARKRAEEKQRQAEESRVAVERAQLEAREQKQRAEREAEGARRMRRLALALFLLAALAAGFAWYATSQRQKAYREAQVAQAHGLIAATYANLIGDPEQSVSMALYAASVLRRMHQPLPREWLEALNRAVQAVAPRQTVRKSGGDDYFHNFAFTWDGRLVATTGSDGTIEVRDVRGAGKVVNLPSSGYIVRSMTFSYDGKLLAAVDGVGLVRIWDTSSGESKWNRKPSEEDPVTCVALSPDGMWLVTGTQKGTLSFWNGHSGLPRPLRPAHTDSVSALAFSRDGKRFASGGGVQDRTVRVWDTASGVSALSLSGHDGSIVSVAFSPHGERLATASEDETAKVWDLATGRVLETVSGDFSPMLGVSFDPSGTRLATASRFGRATIWDATTGWRLLRFRGHGGPVQSVSFDADGKKVLTASGDGTVEAWDVSFGHSKEVMDVSFRPDGTVLASVSRDKTVKLWDVNGRTVLRTLTADEPLFSLAFSRQGLLAAAGEEKSLRMWDLSNPDKPPRANIPTSPSGLSFSSDGSRLATAVNYGTSAKVFAVSGTESKTLTLPPAPADHPYWQINDVVFSPDDKRVAIASSDPAPLIWDLASGTAHRLASKDGHKSRVIWLCFSPDGKMLATASQDTTARIWDAGTGALLHTLSGHQNQVVGIACSSDRRVATAGADGRVLVWDAASGKELYRFDHPGGVEDVAFSPDGKRLATAGDDGMVRVFILNEDELMRAARARVPPRPWTEAECLEYLHQACPDELAAPAKQ